MIGELEKTRRESPLEFRSTLKLAHLYNLYILIDPEKVLLAENYGEMAINLSPNNQQGYWALTQAKIYKGEVDVALFLAEKAIELEPRWLQSHQIAIQVSQIADKPEITEQLIKNAIEINPGWASEFKQATSTQE